MWKCCLARGQTRGGTVGRLRVDGKAEGIIDYCFLDAVSWPLLRCCFGDLVLSYEVASYCRVDRAD